MTKSFQGVLTSEILINLKAESVFITGTKPIFIVILETYDARPNTLQELLE